MRIYKISKTNPEIKNPPYLNIQTGKESDSDHTGTDCDNDKTRTGYSRENRPDKFDKPKRETDPDTTGIDTDSDKTRK